MFLLSVGLGEDMGSAGITIAIGLTVVFLVLLLLTGVFKAFGILMTSFEKKKKSAAVPSIKIPAASAVSPVAAPVVGNTETVSSKPDVDGGVPAETVAVISAAVAAVAPEGKQYAVKGIKKL